MNLSKGNFSSWSIFSKMWPLRIDGKCLAMPSFSIATPPSSRVIFQSNAVIITRTVDFKLCLPAHRFHSVLRPIHALRTASPSYDCENQTSEDFHRLPEGSEALRSGRGGKVRIQLPPRPLFLPLSLPGHGRPCFFLGNGQCSLP